jgi:acyloxyacyl hydrolase
LLSSEDEAQLAAFPDSCSHHNITCKINALVDHKPLQDHDGDRFASKKARRLRGSDWRGYDCDDLSDKVYPGRKTYASSLAEHLQVDHNCNGIHGGNATGSYEDLFCTNSESRGLVILGDSATAHFHVPPQWLTANGWNVDQLLPDAMNELDFPHCSWGTGHAVPEECPYQAAVPGVNGVLSLYTQLRDRNRCNTNDFQNIGVNGARMTSSMQLVNALARDPQNDKPLLVWLALIGNDVCNGHPGFGHMTKPDDFYTHTIETLTALDAVVPPGSHVVSLALFDGELLYATMHDQIHPIGTSYASMYSFMNCLEENPCWGWLNTNATVRRETTLWSDSLNAVYQNISNTHTFKNFKYIYYGPRWMEIFSSYTKEGLPLTNLIEKTDGFHPSQAGNALFAKEFFKFLETEHPDAIGPINPHNAEIDALFFSGSAK